jgi:hypothetical protein
VGRSLILVGTAITRAFGRSGSFVHVDFADLIVFSSISEFLFAHWSFFGLAGELIMLTIVSLVLDWFFGHLTFQRSTWLSFIIFMGDE